MKRTQHRVESEESRRNKEHAEAKRENQKLRREVARLNKEVERLRAYEPLDWQKEAKRILEVKSKGQCCIKCQSEEIRTLVLPIGTLKVCKFCGHREKVQVGRDRKTA